MAYEKQRMFPTTPSKIINIIQKKHPHYALDTRLDNESNIKDASTDLNLICTKHDNFLFKSKWRYLRLSTNNNTGHCTICLVEEGNSRKYIKEFVNKKMRLHKRHSATIIDERYKEYDIIETRESILIECLECGWNKDRVSISNFFAPEPHTDTSYRCSGCVKNGKYGFSRGPSINELKSEFLKLNYELIHKVTKASEQNKDYHLTCKVCKTTNKYTREEVLHKRKYSICQECKRVQAYYDKRDEILKKGFELLTPINEFYGVRHNGEYVKYDFICLNNKHKIKRPLSGFAKTKECLTCKRDKQNSESYITFKNEVVNRGGSVKPKQKLTNRSKELWCICNHQHKFKISYESLIDNGKWCPICNQGIGERVTRIIIEHLLGLPDGFPTIRPDFLKNPSSGSNLELDGFNESAKIGFEYGAEGDTYHSTENQMRYDKLKAKLCKENGVTLIKVPEFGNYGKKVDNINRILSILKKMNIHIVNECLDIDISGAYNGTQSMNQLSDIVQREKAILLTPFVGLNDNVTIQCKNLKHGTFTKTPRDIIHAQVWCNTCLKETRNKKNLYKYKKEFINCVAWLEKNNTLYLNESVDNFTDPSKKLEFKCHASHININSLLDIRCKRKNDVAFCIDCLQINKTIEHMINTLKKHNNFQEHTPEYISLKNGYKILTDGIGKNTKDTTILCNGINRHAIVVKNYTRNNYLRANTWSCPNCIDEEHQLLIKSILGKEAKYIGVKESKHYWNCGIDNHEDFKATPTKIANKKEAACCILCNPRSNTKISKERVLNMAASMHELFSKCEIPPMLLNPDVAFKSTQRIPYKCCHTNHLPFFVSYDNMSRKGYWCPECTNRDRKNMLQDMKEILKIKSLPTKISELILKRTNVTYKP